jgi:hypothetical protein
MEQEFETANGVLNEQESTANENGPKGLLQEIQSMRENGQVGTPEFVSKMRKLEVLLGVSQVSSFGTNELEIFEDDLQLMSNADMQRLATKVGVNPFQDRTILKKILIKEFKDQTKNSRRNIMPTAVNSFIPDLTNPKHQKLMKILGDN